MDLAAIRARDAEVPSDVLAVANLPDVYVDRRALLAEVDRLRDQLTRHRSFGGHVDATYAERARIRAAVEGLGHFRCEDTYYSCRASDDYPLGDIEAGECDCYRAAVLAAIDGEGT